MKILVPSLGESVSEATVAKWLKKEGDYVEKDEILVELETDKATLEVYAQETGILSKIFFTDGQDVQIGEQLAELKEEQKNESLKKSENDNVKDIDNPEKKASNISQLENNDNIAGVPKEKLSINPSEVIRSGAGQKITSDDLKAFLTGQNLSPSQRRQQTIKEGSKPLNIDFSENNKINAKKHSRRVPMSRLQRTMAKRLKNAQNTAAMLTTFNEIDMTEVAQLRSVNKDAFEEKYQVKLGFMSFFCCAVSSALREFPIINSQIEEEEIIYHEHVDLGIALAAPQGLLVPVIRSANLKSFDEIEKEIRYFSISANDGSITTDQMTGATFTISNGGVYGSMLSTPILNPPQSAILGLHQIKERAVVYNGSIEARPVMFVALTYDHRAISGKEAVSFLKKIKDLIEHPDRMLIGL